VVCSPAMCGGIKFIFQREEDGLEQTARVYFPQPKARIPIIHKGRKLFIRWGRREGENENQNVPMTGWARLDKLDSPYWQKFKPEPVLIPALEFSEKGKLPKSRWFPMPSGVYVMGLQLLQPDQPYVFVITNPAAYGLEAVHPRMPHLVREDFSPAAEEFKAALALDPVSQEPMQQKLF
jgi:hypothetical protein